MDRSWRMFSAPLEVGIMGILSLFFSVKFSTGLIGISIILLLVFLTAFFMSEICYGINIILPNGCYETVMNAIVLLLLFKLCFVSR
ncbi:MAG: hypothetical protein ACLRMZ_02285 [Blautia marasmi]